MDHDDTRPGYDGTGAPPVGDRIRRRREELGIAAKDLAERVGISPSYMSLIERQGRVPSPEVAEALAHELGDDVELYVVWARSKGVKDLGTYARRLDRLVRWTTDPEARRRIVSGEELDAGMADEDLDAEDMPTLAINIESPTLFEQPRSTLGTVRARMSRYLSPRAMDDVDRLEEPGSAAYRRKEPSPKALDHARDPVVSRGEPDIVRVPVYPNGADPVDEPEPLEVLDLDGRLVPPEADGLFAYRPDLRSVRRVRDLVHPGDLVILSPRPGPFGSHGVHAVRYEGRVVLTRAAVKSGTLAMLPGPGAPSSIEWIPLNANESGSTAEALARVVAGSVVATLRWWGGTRYARDYDRRTRPR